MSILQHVYDENIKAFNNMLRHTEQKGSDKTTIIRRPSNKGKTVPIVQMRQVGPFVQFISYNELDNLCHVHSWYGSMELDYVLSEDLINISAESYARRQDNA